MAGLPVALVLGIGNALLVAALTSSGLAETPLTTAHGTVHTPPADFAVNAFMVTILLVSLAGLALGALHERNPETGVKTWRLLGVVFLIGWGVVPMALGLAPQESALLINALHLFAGVPALLLLPGRIIARAEATS
jgi:hypothetical protein